MCVVSQRFNFDVATVLIAANGAPRGQHTRDVAHVTRKRVAAHRQHVVVVVVLLPLLFVAIRDRVLNLKFQGTEHTAHRGS